MSKKKNKKNQPTKATKQEIAFSENGLSQARFYFRPFKMMVKNVGV